MIAKVIILLAAFAAAHAVAVAGPWGAGPWLGAGHYGGYAAGSAINHVAPAASLGYAGAYGWGGAYGHGLAGAPLAYGHGGILGARYGGAWGLGHGAGLAKVW